MQLKTKLKVIPKAKNFKAKVLKIMGNVSETKTITVEVQKRLYLSKYKRYYKKNYRYLVHYDLSDSRTKPIQIGSEVVVYECRRLSARKSKVTYGWA